MKLIISSPKLILLSPKVMPGNFSAVNIIFPNKIYFLTKNNNFLFIFPDDIISSMIVLFHDELSKYCPYLLTK